MSEDRMDRAERIRNMREGNRGTDDESESASESESESEPEPEPERDRESEPERTVEPPSDEGAASAAAETETTASDTAEPTADSSPVGTADAGGQPDTPGTDMPTDESGADDAAAVAQRAASAAAEVSGEDTGTGGGSGLAAGPTGVELPDQQLLEEAMSESSVASTEGGARAAAIEEETTQSEELVRVLEFSLGEEYYCLDIEYVEEIVKRDAVTRVPNTADFVDGVVDLRGQITTILEPKEMMDIETEGEQNLIIVFDPDKFEDQGAVGWVVDEVRQVVPITEAEVNSPPVDAEYINGVIDREEYDQFVIWIEPDDALAQATGGAEE
jgi:purine-binding chemotaxis protein CheW